jgi:ABC-2 type transport system ATP-binding protein
LQKDALFEIMVASMNGLNPAQLESLPGVRKLTHEVTEEMNVLNFILQEEAALAGIFNRLTEGGIKIVKLNKHEPTLEDVFVDLVGRSMTEIEEAESNVEE